MTHCIYGSDKCPLNPEPTDVQRAQWRRLEASMRALDLLPATAPELAAQLGITVRLANARLQDYARRRLAQRTDMAVVPLQKRKGRHPHLWVAVIGD